jgi:hypothetical protein
MRKELTVNGRIYTVIEAGEGPLVVFIQCIPDKKQSFK